MKKVFYLMGLVWAGLASTAVAQDNPCGVEGVVVEASSFLYTPSALEIEAGQTVVWVNVYGFHDVNGVTSTIGDAWNNPETFSTSAVSGTAEPQIPQGNYIRQGNLPAVHGYNHPSGCRYRPYGR